MESFCTFQTQTTWPRIHTAYSTPETSAHLWHTLGHDLRKPTGTNGYSRSSSNRGRNALVLATPDHIATHLPNTFPLQKVLSDVGTDWDSKFDGQRAQTNAHVPPFCNQTFGRNDERPENLPTHTSSIRLTVLATNGDACFHWIKTSHITTFVTLNRILLEQNHMPFCDPDESVTQPERLIVDTCTRLCLDRSDGGARDVNRNLKATGRAGTELHIFCLAQFERRDK